LYDCPKSLEEFAARRRQIKCNPFSPGACTWAKILLSLQVWNLFAHGEQIMRAADCKPFVLKGQSPFKTVSEILFAATAAQEEMTHAHEKEKECAWVYLSGTGTDLDSVGDMSANYLYGDFIFY